MLQQSSSKQTTIKCHPLKLNSAKNTVKYIQKQQICKNTIHKNNISTMCLTGAKGGIVN